MELSSLLDGRSSSELERADIGFGASDKDRDFGEGRKGGPSEVDSCPGESVSVANSHCSFRCNNCSLSLLANGGRDGTLCDTLDGVVDDVILRLNTRLSTCVKSLKKLNSKHVDVFQRDYMTAVSYRG
jgi:hypothetical protein